MFQLRFEGGIKGGIKDLFSCKVLCSGGEEVMRPDFQNRTPVTTPGAGVQSSLSGILRSQVRN